MSVNKNIGKITEKELHPSLLRSLKSGSNINIFSETISVNYKTSQIDLSNLQYNRYTDELLVFVNSVFINFNEYRIENNNMIKISGYWNEFNRPTTFDFLIFKNMPTKLLIGSTKINSKSSKIELNNLDYDKNKDGLIIFINSTFLNPSEYSINNNSKYITKISGYWNEFNRPTTFDFLIFKNMPNTDVNYLKETLEKIISEHSNAKDITYDDVTTNIGENNVQKAIEKIIEILNTKADVNVSVLETQIKEILKKFNAKDISYNDILTSLKASNVQKAIEQLNLKINNVSSANNIIYDDNHYLNARNVQDALDKLIEKINEIPNSPITPEKKIGGYGSFIKASEANLVNGIKYSDLYASIDGYSVRLTCNSIAQEILNYKILNKEFPFGRYSIIVRAKSNNKSLGSSILNIKICNNIGTVNKLLERKGTDFETTSEYCMFYDNFEFNKTLYADGNLYLKIEGLGSGVILDIDYIQISPILPAIYLP